MVAHVDDSLLVGSGLEGAVEGVVLSELIGSDGCHGAGETIVAVGRDVGELQCLLVNLLGIIHLILPS